MADAISARERPVSDVFPTLCKAHFISGIEQKSCQSEAVSSGVDPEAG